MVAKRKALGRSLGIGYNVQKKRTLWSLLLAIVITMAVQWNDISQMIPPLGIESKVEIQLESGAYSFDESNIFELIELRKNVPNYDAEIYMKVLSENVEIGNDVSFKISIVDRGIVKLQKPYFYIMLVAPSGQVVSVFPKIYHISPYDKMPTWGTEHARERKKLIDGRNVIYKFEIGNEPESIGRWKLYLFLYDETYVDRFGNSLDSDNFVRYSLAEFDTGPKSESEQIPVAKIKYLLVPFAITFVITYWGVYSQIERNREKIVSMLRKVKKYWTFVLSIILIVIAQLWFFLM